MAAFRRERTSLLPRGPSRPSQGIRSEYARVKVYLPTNVRDGLERLADWQGQRTGQSTVGLMSFARRWLPTCGSICNRQKSEESVYAPKQTGT
jgi:hypothetical protein